MIDSVQSVSIIYENTNCETFAVQGVIKIFCKRDNSVVGRFSLNNTELTYGKYGKKLRYFVILIWRHFSNILLLNGNIEIGR